MSPRFSVIIPSLDEAARLGNALESAHAAFGDAAEYIVSDGGSRDGTVEIARRAGALVISGEAGRGAQLDRGFRAASGEICVFLHADTVVQPTAPRSIENAIATGAIAGAFSIEFIDARLGLLRGAINLRSRIFRNATGDQVIFALASALRAIGGVPNVPLFEDVRLCAALKRAGKFVVLSEKVGTSARLWRESGPVRGVLLHWAFRLMHALGVSPYWLASRYPHARS